MSVDQLKRLFEVHSIRKVAIIDDAYLERPTIADLRSIDGLKPLWAGIEASDEILEFLNNEGISLSSPDDIKTDQLERLYDLRSKSPALSSVLDQFDEIQLSKREQLRALEELLREIGVNPEELMPSAPLKAEALPDLIFLDYYLDPTGLESSLPLARSVGKNIKDAFAAQAKPYVVLMSTLTEISAENRALFRDTAEVIGGMFHFIPKVDLQERSTLVLKLALMVRSIEEGRKIQQFVERYDDAIHTVANEFQKKVRGLSLEDYAYIQKLSLQGEGQPLGDYVLWLFGMYFSHLLAHANPDGRKVLDGMIFTHIPDALAPPSPDFVSLYQNVVSEEVDDLTTHPRLSEQERERLGDQAPPDPHFGDVFFGENGAVLVIATAECDLAYAPEPTSGRAFDPEMPVLLVPGELQQHPAFLAAEKTTTEFVEVDGKNYRILWSLKKFKTVPAGTLRNLRQQGFVRRRHLRMPFSHVVQQALTKDIERIGVPVAPPMLQAAAVNIYYRDGDGNPYLVAGPKEGAVISFVIQGESETIQLRLSAVASIVSECTNALAELEKFREKVDPRRQPGIERDIAALRAFLGNFERQLALAESFALKSSEEHQVQDAPIKILRGITEDQLKNWRPKQPIIVVVTEITPPEAQAS